MYSFLVSFKKIISHRAEKRKDFFLRIIRPFKRHIWCIQKLFGNCDENSLENTGFALAFCAIFLYNKCNVDYGGVCTWVN